MTGACSRNPTPEAVIPRALTPDPETGRRRSAAARDAVLSATQALLASSGFARLSIEAVAAAAGVGKATIYRWWPNKGVLAVEAFLAGIAPAIAFPATGSARDALQAQMLKVGEIYRGDAGRIVREMIALSQSDRDTNRLFVEGYIEPRRAAAGQVLRRGIERGEFRSGIDTGLVVDALYGPIFHRMLTSHAPIDDAFVSAHATLILDAIAAP